MDGKIGNLDDSQERRNDGDKRNSHMKKGIFYPFFFFILGPPFWLWFIFIP